MVLCVVYVLGCVFVCSVDVGENGFVSEVCNTVKVFVVLKEDLKLVKVLYSFVEELVTLDNETV